MTDLPFYLGSASPRRKDLLQARGLSFSVLVAPCEERLPQGISVENGVALLACQKALACAQIAPKMGVCLGADTVVAQGQTIFGKPRDRSHARAMLQALSHSSHRVCTGMAFCLKKEAPVEKRTAPCVCLPNASFLPDLFLQQCPPVLFLQAEACYLYPHTEQATVTFFPLSCAQIEAYLDTDEPYDKAGAYAWQGAGGAFVKETAGDPETVVGLPTRATEALLSFACGLSFADFKARDL